MKPPLLFARSLFLPADLGGNRYPYEVVQRLGGRGRSVTVVTPRLYGSYPVLTGVSYHHYPVFRQHPALTHLTNLLGATLALRRLPGAQYEAALAGSYDVALALGWSGVSPRVPLVFLFHSQFYSEWVQALERGPRAAARRLLRAYMAGVERRVFALSTRIVAVSNFSARQIAARAPSTAARVKVIPTGVDTRYFSPPSDRAAAKDAVGIPPGEIMLLGVGRLVAVKQFDRLVEAFDLARKDGLPPARLVLAGDGPDRPRLERLVAARGLAPYVEFRGFCGPEALRTLMQAADLQVCSSAFENFSLAILEGMACGAAVLGTPGGGTPELVGSIDPGLVLADDAPATIASGLRRFCSDPAELTRLGQHAQALTADRYDWERVVDQLETVCAEAGQ